MPLRLRVQQPSCRSAGKLSPALRRKWEGFRGLPPVQQVSNASLQAGVCCCRVPLWGTPLL